MRFIEATHATHASEPEKTVPTYTGYTGYDVYLGIDVYRPGLGRLLRGLAERKLENVRILCGDAASLIENQVSDQSLAGVYVFFPDPWPKKRHHKRRLMRPEFVAMLRRKLCSHARVFLATDWEDYARHIVQVMDVDGGFVNLAGRAVYAPRPRWRPLTRYEQRAEPTNAPSRYTRLT